MKNLQTMKQSVQKGFTLIELMIVVAIIGILAAIAIPAYTDYTIKSRVSEGASLVAAPKTAMEVYWSENGTQYGPGAGSVALTAFDLNLCETAGCNAWTTDSEYVSAILLDNTAAATPNFEVHYKNLNSLGDAKNTCVVYFPNIPDTAGQNITWEVRAEIAYTTAGGSAAEAATCTTVDAIPNKYKPKA